MGEITDMMLEGDLCMGCGVFMGSFGDVFPRYCEDCKEDEPPKKKTKAKKAGKK